MKSSGHRHWLLILTLAACGADARDLNQNEALKLRQQGMILPLEQLIEHALTLYPGAKLLEAGLEEEHDRYIYEVELLTAQGVVRELKFDASDSRLLKDKEDD
jgi:uncharacterized membrane protein YkoI